MIKKSEVETEIKDMLGTAKGTICTTLYLVCVAGVFVFNSLDPKDSKASHADELIGIYALVAGVVLALTCAGFLARMFLLRRQLAQLRSEGDDGEQHPSPTRAQNHP